MIPDRTPDFSLQFTSGEINDLLKGEGPGTFTRHFSGSEEFFLRFSEPFEVPSFAIHHDYQDPKPAPLYFQGLRTLLTTLKSRMGDALSEATWYFNPLDIFHPGFYQLYDIKGRQYLYVLRLDLGFRPRGCEILEPGTNDTTPYYRTKNLYIEAEIVPLEPQTGVPRQYWIHRYFSETWMGEQGRGYFVQGVWIDDSVSKFISRIFIPPEKKLYPYFPFRCRYGTVSSTVVSLPPKGRHQAIRLLDRALKDLEPRLEDIQKLLRTEDFREDLPLFRDLRGALSPAWRPVWEKIEIHPSINEDEQKEYLYDEH